MSKTPRTDEQILHHDNGNGHPSAFVFASFTRQLETELADKDKKLAEKHRQRDAYKKALEMAEDELMTARAEIERKNKLIEQMREALKLVDSLPFVLPKWFDGDDFSVWDIIKAALAAERGE